jgi:hypothetical protein
MPILAQFYRHRFTSDYGHFVFVAMAMADGRAYMRIVGSEGEAVIKKTLTYADYGGAAVVCINDSGGVGWYWHATEGKWKRSDLHMYLHSAVHSKTEFERVFGQLPEPPIDDVQVDEAPVQPPLLWRSADEIEKEWENEKLGSARAIQLEAEIKALYAGVRAQLGPEWKAVLEDFDKFDC